MFGFAQWDSPLALVLEFLLSVAIIVALLLVVRKVNANAAAERQRYIETRRQAGAPHDATQSSRSMQENGQDQPNGGPTGPS